MAWLRRVRDCATFPGCLPRCLCAADRRRYLGVPCVSEEVEARDQDSIEGNRTDQKPAETIEADVAMKTDKLELVRGSGNVFRDLKQENADAQQFKAILAA